MIHFDEYDVTQQEDYDYREEWVHVDDLPDFDEIRAKLIALSKMVEEDISKSDILMMIDDISRMM